MNNSTESKVNDERRDANTCIALGAGLGTVSAGTALIAGATCPLCVVLAPALIGFGAWKRFTAPRRSTCDSSTGKHNQAESSPFCDAHSDVGVSSVISTDNHSGCF